MSNPIFYEGQVVGCLMFGEGVVSSVRTKGLNVDFADNRHCFLLNGARMINARPTLYPIDQYRSIIANLPAPQPEAWKPKRGDFCWFGSEQYKDSMAILARFEQMGERGYMAKINGGLSCYDFCYEFTGELPEHLKEVKP